MDVWKYMLKTHNNDVRCVITGSSTHNERIERLWRDVHRSITHFANLFRTLESDRTLDTLNEVDTFSLHYVFLPIISKCLLEFKDSWNNHALSSEGNMTPYQLFAEGMMCAKDVNCSTISSVDSIQVGHQHEIQFSANDSILVPRISFSPCDALTCQLHLSISPLEVS